jgi:hypothetical protein
LEAIPRGLDIALISKNDGAQGKKWAKHKNATKRKKASYSPSGANWPMQFRGTLFCHHKDFIG